jgi:hypothetical protein
MKAEKQDIENVIQVIEEIKHHIMLCASRKNGKSNLQLKFDRAYLMLPELLKELKAYKDAEEQGLLFRLPCKPKQIVYILDPNFCRRIHRPFKCEVDEFVIDRKSCFAVLNACEHYYAMRRFKAVNIDNFGKTVFLTGEEATAAFKAAQEGE